MCNGQQTNKKNEGLTQVINFKTWSTINGIKKESLLDHIYTNKSYEAIYSVPGLFLIIYFFKHVKDQIKHLKP